MKPRTLQLFLALCLLSSAAAVGIVWGAHISAFQALLVDQNTVGVLATMAAFVVVTALWVLVLNLVFRMLLGWLLGPTGMAFIHQLSWATLAWFSLMFVSALLAIWWRQPA